MRLTRSITFPIAVIVLAGISTPPSNGALCPFCTAPSLTLSEQLAQADAAVLVQWVEGTKANQRDPGSTTYEVLEVLRSVSVKVAKDDGSGKEALSKLDRARVPTLAKGDRITLERYRGGKKGDLFLLMGTMGVAIEWGSPLEVTETSYNYVAQAPSPETASLLRLTYFLRFLEYPDPLISNDAFSELANAPYRDIEPLKSILPPKRIREWLTNPDTSSTRIGLYGMLLGLCGNDDDATFMERKINEETDAYRLGIDGLIGGYLLLTGEKGLDLIDNTKLKNTKVPFSETYSAMQALRFMWSYGNSRIDKERLRASMRVLLDRPELADLVIADLARWKDWKVQDRLMDLYGAEEYNIPSIKRAIIRYMLQASKDGPAGDGGEIPEHVASARKYVETLRKNDPKTVEEAERFFFFN